MSVLHSVCGSQPRTKPSLVVEMRMGLVNRGAVRTIPLPKQGDMRTGHS